MHRGTAAAVHWLKMMSALATFVLVIAAVAKVWLFVVSVRNALRPRHLPTQEGRIDPDGPDDGWRWWEEFGPEPQPPEPEGELQVSGPRSRRLPKAPAGVG